MNLGSVAMTEVGEGDIGVEAVGWVMFKYGIGYRDMVEMMQELECPASFVPVELIQTWNKGAFYGTREET